LDSKLGICARKNALGHDDLSKSLGINPNVELASGGSSDLELAVRPRNGLAQSLTFSTGIVPDEPNRSVGQPVSLGVSDLASQRNLLTQERKRELSQQNEKNREMFSR
jgi:hypothetical protein